MHRARIKQLTLLTIDDHELFRAGIELIIKNNFPNVGVVSAAGLGGALDGLEGAPDIVLLDLNLPGVGGMAALSLIRLHWPHARVIVVTSEQDPRLLEKVREEAGVRVVSKAQPPQALVGTIRELIGESGAGGGSDPPAVLSPRQVEVLRHLKQGHPNKAIARLMGLSEFTVRGHVRQIIRVTGASNRTNAVFLAERGGLI